MFYPKLTLSKWSYAMEHRNKIDFKNGMFNNNNTNTNTTNYYQHYYFTPVPNKAAYSKGFPARFLYIL